MAPRQRPDPLWVADTGLKKDANPVDAIRALKLAIVDTFDEPRWRELGIAIGHPRLVTGHYRLLRSLHWGDDDYDTAAHQVLMVLLGENLENFGEIEAFVGLKTWLAQHDAKLYARLYDGEALENTLPLDRIEEASEIHNVADLGRQAVRIHNAIDQDPALAIGQAKELLETVLKTILGEDDTQGRAEIPDLLKRVRQELDLDPKSAAAGANEVLKRTLSNLGQVVTGVAEVRNLHGTGHGRTNTKELDGAHARLVVNSAITAATFLLEVWQAKKGRL